MPNIKSAKKRVKVTKVRTEINKSRKSNLKTVLKKAELSIKNNDSDKASAFKAAIKCIDQACSKGILHKNCAARKKSKLAIKFNKS